MGATAEMTQGDEQGLRKKAEAPKGGGGKPVGTSQGLSLEEKFLCPWIYLQLLGKKDCQDCVGGADLFL